jgi:hypothetical protein
MYVGFNPSSNIVNHPNIILVCKLVFIREHRDQSGNSLERGCDHSGCGAAGCGVRCTAVIDSTAPESGLRAVLVTAFSIVPNFRMV